MYFTNIFRLRCNDFQPIVTRFCSCGFWIYYTIIFLICCVWDPLFFNLDVTISTNCIKSCTYENKLCMLKLKLWYESFKLSKYCFADRMGNMTDYHLYKVTKINIITTCWCRGVAGAFAHDPILGICMSWWIYWLSCKFFLIIRNLYMMSRALFVFLLLVLLLVGW